MDNQHQKIKGYRDLSQEEIDLMNEGKELEEKVARYLTRLRAALTTDQRDISIARTQFENGFMRAIRSIAKPESPWKT